MTDEEIKSLKEALDNNFKTRHSFASLKRIMDNSGAEYICSGTGRLVYKVSDTRVFKVAKNQAGLAQNGVEADWALRNYGVAANWYDIADDYIWIESEFCKKAKTSDFVEQVGCTFKYFCECIRYYESDLHPRAYYHAPKPDKFEETYDWDNLLSNIYSYIVDFDVPVGDLTRISSYGINQKGELVLTDTGLNNYIYREYYDKSKIGQSKF